MRQYPIGLEDGWSVKQRYVHFMNACWEDNHEIVRGLGDCGWKKKQDEGDSSDNVEEIQHRTTGRKRDSMPFSPQVPEPHHARADLSHHRN